MSQEHYRRLANMYKAAPFNALFEPALEVRDAEATVEIDIKEQYHHAAHAVHGSVYFKLLDDAAFFAANSLETEYFVLTTSFTTYLTRPVSSGRLKAVGKVVNKNRSQFIAEAIIYDSEEREIGRGNGVFVRSKMLLKDAMGYMDELEA